MAIYRKGEDQMGLWRRAGEQNAERNRSEADSNGYIIGLNPSMTVKEYSEELGGGPVSAKGMRQGASALHSQRTHPNTWKAAGFTLSDERGNK